MATATLPIDRTVSRGHWARPDVAADLLAVAWAPGVAPPREVRVRPELHARLLAELGPAVAGHGLLGDPAGVPLVVDPELPACPGFEVRRVLPGGPVRPRALAA
jgi:hypothetical protein